MKIVSTEHGTSVAMGKTSRADEWSETGKQGKQKEQQGGSIFAGDLNGIGDDITQRRREAMQKALKVLTDQFAVDSKIDEGVAESRQNIAAGKARMKEANDAINELQAEKEAVREAHGVAADSQEQQDLELIEKARQANKEGSLDSLSTEELTRLSEMGPLTDYQREALNYTDLQDIYRSRIKAEKDAIMGESQAIAGTKQALLGRQYDMSDASRESSEMQKRAAKEIAGMLTAEAKQHIDEEFEKLKEEARKKAEEKKEQEEALEELRQKKEEMEQQIEAAKENAGETAQQTEAVKENAGQTADMTRETSELEKQLHELQDMGRQRELLPEDMKGLAVNQFL